MVHQGAIEFEGTVLEAFPDTTFKVKLADGRTVLAALSGQMRRFHIRVMPGDEVKVEMTPYDEKRGRIVYRAK
jgi:translation initiation factor IF-1